MTVSETAFAALDFESAGIRPGGTETAVQIGIAVMDGIEIVPARFLASYLSTTEPITWRARKVHGITTRDLRGAPSLLGLWPSIRNLLEGRWLVGHGSATERRFLRAFPFHGFGPWVDTLKLSRAVWPSLDSFALGDLIAQKGLEDKLREVHPNFRWHDALSDAVASLILLRHILLEGGLLSRDNTTLLQPNETAYYRLRTR